MQIKVRLAPCAIVSHCCELELRNGKCLLPMITVARIVPVKESVSRDPEKMPSLKANKDPRNQSDLGYLDYFYLEPDDAMARLEYVVDFSQLAPVPGTEYQSLLHRKMLQLSDRERAKFKIKLPAYLARPYRRRVCRWLRKAVAMILRRLQDTNGTAQPYTTFGFSTQEQENATSSQRALQPANCLASLVPAIILKLLPVPERHGHKQQRKTEWQTPRRQG